MARFTSETAADEEVNGMEVAFIRRYWSNDLASGNNWGPWYRQGCEQPKLIQYCIRYDIGFTEDVGVTIKNMRDAKSGGVREDDKVVDISLANCYTLEDVVRELVGLVKRQEKT